MTESIGTARLDIVVDTSGFDAAISSAKRSVSGMSSAAQAEYNKLSQVEKRRVDSLIKQADTLKLTREQQILYNATLKGVPTNILDELKGKLGGAEKATHALATSAGAASKAFAGTNKTARELQFAMRGVPAQVTDIVTSLASGQRPMMVLLQQGGQLKDMFGGIAPAARALGGAIAGFINPVTIAAAAVGLLGFAWVKAADQAAEFNKALVATGLNASLTAGDLEKMADQIGRTTNASSGHAAEVLAQVTASGRFTADQINLVAEAATRMESATGKAIQDTINEFVRLQDDPVSAILKLNEAQHFLTEETLKQITSLKDQGNEAGAAAVAIRAYADTINTRAPEIESHLSAWTLLWHDVKDAAGDAFGVLVSGFRDTSGAAQSAIASTVSLNSALSATGGLASAAFATIFKLRAAQAAAADGRPDFSDVQDNGGSKIGRGGGIIDSRAAKAKIDAEKEFANLAESNLSKREKLEAEIVKIRELGKKAGKDDLAIQKEINNARARYEESLPKGKKPKKENTRGIENASDRFSDMVGRFQSELQGPLEKAEQEHLKRMRELQQAARDGKRSHDELAAALKLEGEAYAKTSDDIKHRFDTEVAALLGPVAQAQDAHEQALRRIEELKKQGALTAEKYTAALQAEAKAYEQDARAAERAADPLAALLEDMQVELGLIGKSNAERAVMIELRRKNIDAMSDEGQAALATARQFEQEAKAKQQSIELMDKFRSGAVDALSDFVTGAKSAKDALKDFFDSMAQAITQAIAQKWIDQLFGPQGSSQTGSSGGWISSILGLITGGGGGEQWYANGGAFSGGVQKFATGGVFDKPTMFGMAGGRMGVMGEAGPEAVLPLHRGRDGKLGVRMAANDDSPRERVINNNTTFVLPEVVTRQTQDQWAQKQQRAATRATSRNR